MGRVHRETPIAAPRERVFDLARHVGAHVATMPDEDAESETDLLELHDTVTFRQRQFGVPFELTARITEFDVAAMGHGDPLTAGGSDALRALAARL